MNGSVIRKAALYSNMVYDGIGDSMPFDVDGIQGCVLHDVDNVWVVFRGTDEPGDWLTNLEAWKTMTQQGGIHTGFFAAWTRVEAAITRLLWEMPKKPVIATGHSLGGALAVMTIYLQDHVTIITFGQPRVGDAEFCQRLADVEYSRVVNSGDPVTQVPSGLRFDHAGEEIWFDPDGNRTEPTKWDRVKGWVASLLKNWGRFKSASLTSHDMRRYYSNVQKAEGLRDAW